MTKFDVVVIGAGVVGCLTARELKRFDLSVAVIEASSDVAMGASKANSGIVHAGFDAETGSLKAKFNIEGNEMFDCLSKELDFPFKRNGSLVLCFDKNQKPKLEELYNRGVKNGVKGLRIIEENKIKVLEPNVGKAVYALLAPSGGIVGPYEMTIAAAESAATNGAEFYFDCEVTGLAKDTQGFIVKCDNGKSFNAKLIINCAGCGSDAINNMVSSKKLKILPRRGEYSLFDKASSATVSHTLFQLPTEMGKGILVSPTVHGNILAGPTAKNVLDPKDKSTTEEGLEEVYQKACITVPALKRKEIITQFVGMRAHLEGEDDFVVGESEPNFFNAAGVESPGLTSAPAIARFLASKVGEKLNANVNKSFNPIRKGITEFASLSEKEKAEIVKNNPHYGRIVCRCESVTEGEIIESIRRKPGAKTLDGVKHRTRAGMGRCQSGFCSPRVLEILARELGQPLVSITKSGVGSTILVGKNKEL